MSIYADVPKGPAIEVFALTQAFKDDSNPNKVNLSVGVGSPLHFSTPRTAGTPVSVPTQQATLLEVIWKSM
ncbi:GM13274 [Drosophila sechellia]|uniref:GM13274 n=1 Tax=Drosophila sechellia TaxID=7238 RepID=B4IP10_DROSE|nr:GM13274 [Drosophila sechellia]